VNPVALPRPGLRQLLLHLLRRRALSPRRELLLYAATGPSTCRNGSPGGLQPVDGCFVRRFHTARRRGRTGLRAAGLSLELIARAERAYSRATGGLQTPISPSGWTCPWSSRLQRRATPGRFGRGGGVAFLGRVSARVRLPCAEAATWRRFDASPAAPAVARASARPLGLSSMAELFADLFRRTLIGRPMPSACCRATRAQGRLATAICC